MEGDDDRKINSDYGNKPKEISTSLWKYVTKVAREKGGGTTKFACFHCRTTYTGSYTCVRKHLYEVMPRNEKKTIRIKNYDQVRHQKIEANIGGKRRKHKTNPKKSRVEYKTSNSYRTFSG